MASPTILAVIIAYFTLMIGIGFWANRRTKSSKEFLVAGQSLGFFVMAIASFASIQSGFGMVGHTGQVYDVGISGLIAASLFAPLGFILAWFVLGTRLYAAARKYSVYSVPDFVRARYQSRPAQVAMSFAMAIGAIAYMTTQIAAMGVIAALLLGVSVQVGAWIGAAVIATYTIAGGMLAAIWTDLIQGLLMVAMSIVVFFLALGATGGWGSMLATISNADPVYLTISDGRMQASYVFSFLLLAMLGGVGQPQLITKFLMLRDKSELKWGALVAASGYALTSLFIISIGMSLRALTISGETPVLPTNDEAATTFLSQFTNPVFAGLALTALMAAIMSSASSFITIGAAALVHDLSSALDRRLRAELFWNRVAAAVITVLSVLLVFQLSQVIFILGAIGWAAFAASTLGPIAVGAYWHRGTGTAVVWSVVVGLSSNVLVALLASVDLLQIPAEKSGPASIMIGLLTYVVVSFLTSNDKTTGHFDAFVTVPQSPKAREAVHD